MADDRFARLAQLLDQALELPEVEREAFVRAGAGDDRALLGAALAALAEEADPATAWRDRIVDALATPEPGAEPATATDLPANAGRRCGPWRLVRSIGAGGMGEVFLAERADGAFEQLVAIKVLPPALRSSEFARRLERERQILARLEHPNIARLVDGGLADDGTPYLALEFVEGTSLLAWASERRLGIAARLALFLELCDAVSFAHSHLVVHRDLKPSNVMVSAGGRAKLLDFGIAKLVEEDNLGATRTQSHLLTPRYAAPEQIEGRPATTATDVHALGLLLFELLAGVPAFGRDATTAISVAREIVESEVEPPSRVAEDSRFGASAALARDLDEICRKALRKAPVERYRSVAALADDVRRAVAGEAVEARAGARFYATLRFVRRHRWGVAGVAIVLLALAAGLAVAIRERDAARTSEARAEAIRRFLVEDLLLAATPEEARGRELTVREALDSAGARATRALAGDPEVELGVRAVLGDAYLRLGEIESAAREIAREEALVATGSGREPRASTGLRRLRLHLARHDYAAALELASELLRELADDPRAARSRALVLALRGRAEEGGGKYARAEATYREARAALASQPGTEREALEVLGYLVTNLSLQRKDLECEAAAAELVDAAYALHGTDHPSRVVALDARARAYRRLSRTSEADAAATDAVVTAGRILPPGHPLSLAAMRTRVATLRDAGNADEARALAERVLDIARSSRGEESLDFALAAEHLAVFRSFDGSFEAAGELYEHALGILKREYGELHPTTLRVLRNQAALFRRQASIDRHRAAGAHLVELARSAAELLDLDPAVVDELASIALRIEPSDLRDPQLGLLLADRVVEATDRRWLDALATLARAHEETGNLPAAVAVLSEAFELPNCLLDSSLARRMKRLLIENGEQAKVDPFLQGLAAARRARYPNDISLEADTLYQLAVWDREVGRSEEAVTRLLAADLLLAPGHPPSHPDRVTGKLELARAYVALGRIEDARNALLPIAEELARRPDEDPDLRREVDEALAKLES